MKRPICFFLALRCENMRKLDAPCPAGLATQKKQNSWSGNACSVVRSANHKKKKTSTSYYSSKHRETIHHQMLVKHHF